MPKPQLMGTQFSETTGQLIGELGNWLRARQIEIAGQPNVIQATNVVYGALVSLIAQSGTQQQIDARLSLTLEHINVDVQATALRHQEGTQV